MNRVEEFRAPLGYTRFTEEVGKILLEGIKNSRSERFRKIREALSIREDLTLGNNSALTTTAVAAFVEKELRPELIAQGVIKTTAFTLKGSVGLKIPKGVNLTASDIVDSVVTADDQDYGSITITPKWVGLRTTFTYELLQQANVDVIADKLEEAGFAIAQKIDSDILAEIQKASTKNDATYGDNGNYVYTGTGTDISWSTITNAIEVALNNRARPDVILFNPTNYRVLLQDPDVKNMIKFATGPAGQVANMITTLHNMKVVVSSQVPANHTFLVDTRRLGYFVDASPVQTWDGRIDNTIKQEVIAAKAYGVGIARPKAITSIIDNTDEPA